MTLERINSLFNKYYTSTATAKEEQELFQWLAESEDRQSLLDSMETAWKQPTTLNPLFTQQTGENLLHQIIVPPAKSTPFLQTYWLRYAAAMIILLGGGIYFWMTNKTLDTSFVNGQYHAQTEITPGGNFAILTLADGRRIALDSAANGHLASQGGVEIVKLENGQISYAIHNPASKEVMWNTLTTPVGGQHQITLPDGTKVWLNAASSITYPATFVGAKRTVKVTGEAYFEVSPNKEKPFILDVDGKSLIEVLGTSFNVNSYADEASIKTTLLEGSVKIALLEPMSKNQTQNSGNPTNTSAAWDRTVTESVILKPGQQSSIALTPSLSSDNTSDGQYKDQYNTPGSVHTRFITVAANPDLDKAIAWKNGLFNFNQSDLKSVMRQLERWYNIKVKYEGAVPSIVFMGKMDRGVNLSDVLAFFTKMGVQYRLEEKTLIITNELP